MTNTIPERVELICRKVGGFYVFTCTEIPGLHISDRTLEGSFFRSVSALSKHASATFGCEVKYVFANSAC